MRRPSFDAKALVQVGIVDEALPAHRRARLFEIDPHHDLQGLAVTGARLLQPPRVVQRRAGIVDRAGADHHQQPVVLRGHDVVDVPAGFRNELFHGGAANREKADQVFGRGQHGDFLDAFVVGLAGLVDGVRIPGIAGGVGCGVHFLLL